MDLEVIRGLSRVLPVAQGGGCLLIAKPLNVWIPVQSKGVSQAEQVAGLTRADGRQMVALEPPVSSSNL
ncbi:MAG: hypothetical protein R6U00_08460 [Prochlorococcaceae cyanobacterium]